MLTIVSLVVLACGPFSRLRAFKSYVIFKNFKSISIIIYGLLCSYPFITCSPFIFSDINCPSVILYRLVDYYLGWGERIKKKDIGLNMYIFRRSCWKYCFSCQEVFSKERFHFSSDLGRWMSPYIIAYHADLYGIILNQILRGSHHAWDIDLVYVLLKLATSLTKLYNHLLLAD